VQINAQSQFPVDEFMGVNWQAKMPRDGIECVGFVREFSRWVDTQEGAKNNPALPEDLYPNECLNLNPVTTGVEAGMDFFYEGFQGFGMGISPSMTMTIPTYSGNTSGNVLVREQWLPIQWIPDGNGGWEAGEDTEIPASYLERADWMYHYIGRYGSGTTVPDVLDNCQLKYCAQEDDQANLGYLNYVESWNEPNRSWTNDGGDPIHAQFSPQEYAAMASCDFDGHESTILAEREDCNGYPEFYPVGVRNIDENINFVMGGPYDIEYALGSNGDPGFGLSVWDYWLNPMRQWFIDNRTDDLFPFDVINFHHYSTEDPGNLSLSWYCPEQDRLRARMETLIGQFPPEWADREVWISEFGYDTSEDDISGWDYGVNIPGHPLEGLTAELLQAQWIIRSYLELIASGVDRAMVHYLRDETSNPTAQWDLHTGLITEDGAPKESWFYTFSMKNILTGYHYVEDMSTAGCDLSVADATDCDGLCTRIYRFENAVGENIWAVWSPTACNIDPYEVTFNVQGATGATGLRLAAPSINGVIEPVTFSGGDVTVMASETPIFILEGETTAPECPILSISDPSIDITCSSVTIDVDLPLGETYDAYQIWVGEQGVDLPSADAANFTAFGGNVDQFQYGIPGGIESVSIVGLEPGTNYFIYVLPETSVGIPVTDTGTPELCHIQVTTSTQTNICRIPITDMMLTETNGDGIVELFDEQDLDFCSQNTTPTGGSWLTNYANGNSVSVIITLEDYYQINQLYLYDDFGGGIMRFEWSEDGSSDWQSLTDYYTTAQLEWVSLNNFTQPALGVKYLRITAESDQAKVKEMFICGDVIQDCDVNVSAEDANCVSATIEISKNQDSNCEPIAADFTFSEQSDFSGATPISINSNSFTGNTSFELTFPQPPLVLGDVLIPNITYNGRLRVANSNAIDETLLTIQTESNTSSQNGCIDGPKIIGRGYLACSNQGPNFSPRMLFFVPANIPANSKIQFWLSTTGATFSPDVHPLVSDPTAVSIIVQPGPVISAFKLGPARAVWLVDLVEGATYTGAYRYVTQSESSELNTTMDYPSPNTTFEFTAYGCYGAPTSLVGGTTSLVAVDCDIIGILKSETPDRGSYEIVERATMSNNPSLSPLTSAVVSATGEDIYYEFQEPTQIKYIYSRWSDGTTTDPWDYVETDIDPCAGGKSDDSDIGNKQSFAKIYPNPTKAILNLVCNDCMASELFSIDGRKLPLRLLKQSTNTYQFDTSQLSDGMYFIQITNSAGGRESLRFVVQR